MAKVNNNLIDESLINELPGPILVIGASGFIGFNLLNKISNHRKDVFGTYFSSPGSRLTSTFNKKIFQLDNNSVSSIKNVLTTVKPRIIFDCSSYGSYSFESSYKKIFETNTLGLINTIEQCLTHDIHSYIYSGSSSEYGLNSDRPKEDSKFIPNSHYSLSKISNSFIINYYGKQKKFPILNLRLYSVYGDYEDSSRLIPNICISSLSGKLPSFAEKEVSRDFVHIDDVVNAFILASKNINSNFFGNSYNIGTGVKTSIKDIASLSKKLFKIKTNLDFNSKQNRAWDLKNWVANNKKSITDIRWTPLISLEDGLLRTQEWWKNFLDSNHQSFITKQKKYSDKSSISAIVACYKDQEAIPLMYNRLKTIFIKENIDYEIIFINDNSPDDSQKEIKKITAADNKVIGISHSRNFGSQAAFRSGMELYTKEACVLLDGDLQDPPEIIPKFIKKWRDGYDVVYGIRTKREMSYISELPYKIFYYFFNKLSEFQIPRDAGDFSLIDRKVSSKIINCSEKDFFLRGIRAYVGFSQIGIPYFRPERRFGNSTNNLFKNLGWAKKGIFSFTRIPLHLLTAIGISLFLLSITIIIVLSFNKFMYPDKLFPGIALIAVLVLFFSSLILLSIAILGEYISKIFEETKNRPYAIRKEIIKNGEIKALLDESL